MVNTWYNRIETWVKSHWVVLSNSGAMVGTMAVSSALGFIYWWVAAQLFPQKSVGLASAAVTAMLLLGEIGTMGIGTLIIGQLRKFGKTAGDLILTAGLATTGVAVVVGILFAGVSGTTSTDLQPLGVSIGSVFLFAAGVAFTSLGIVGDQLSIGLLKGDFQFWRNTIIAAAKLVILAAFGWLLNNGGGLRIYASWVLGAAISILYLVFVILRFTDVSFAGARPRWSIVKQLGELALGHQGLNVVIQAPSMLLPVIVTIILSAEQNASFYIAWTIANFIYIGANSLALVLYAVAGSSTQEELAQQLRFSVRISLILSILGGLVVFVAAGPMLGIFGVNYATTQTFWSLRIMVLLAVPVAIRSHYVAIQRIRDKPFKAAMVLGIAALCEIIMAIAGAQTSGQIGLMLGWGGVVIIEALLILPSLLKTMGFFGSKSTTQILGSDRDRGNR